MKYALAISIALLLTTLAAPRAHAVRFVSFDFAPYTEPDNAGHAVGPFALLIHRICAEMGEECPIKLVPNRRAKMLLERDKADAIFPISWNTERVSEYYFSIPLVTSEYGLFVPGNNQTQITSIEQLQGYRIAVFSPSNTYSSLLELQAQMKAKGLKPFEIVKKTDANGQIVRMLERERFDAYYSNKQVAESRAKQFGVSEIRYAWRHKRVHYFVGFLKKSVSSEFVHRFNQTALRFCEEDNLFETVLAQYKLNYQPATPELLLRYSIRH